MKVTYGAIVQRASGRFGGTVHSNWKGIDVVRRFAKPTNPNTDAQQSVRAVFRTLTFMYGLFPTYTKSAWTTFATGKAFIARNKLIALNVPTLTGQTDFAAFLPTPGDSSTLPPAAFTPTGANDSITTSVTPPTIPSGWSITSVIACAILSTSDPAPGSLDADDLTVYEGRDTTDPYAPTITCPGGQSYFTWAFIEWLAPDGTTRFSSALSGGAAVTTT